MKKERARYHKFSLYLKETFGCRVYKISLDAGFSCPNRDGKLSNEGCIYCDNAAFSVNTRVSGKSLEDQIKQGMDFGRKRYNAEKFIVYFQAYTNTYAPLNVLKERYDVIRKFEDIVGLSIGTRPDCIDEATLDLIKSYSDDYDVWIEYGLQSVNPNTLEFINRGHTYEDFLNAFTMTKRKGIKVCVHVIIGLPNETEKEILNTAKALATLKLDGVKVHPLHIVKGTKLERSFNEGSYKALELDEFVRLSTEFLKYLWPDTVVQRISADCPESHLAAPLWILNKPLVLDMVDERLKKEDAFQGIFYKKSCLDIPQKVDRIK